MVFEADSEIDNMFSVHEEKKYFQNLVQNIKGKVHLGVIYVN
jgi:hypothetical protein